MSLLPFRCSATGLRHSRVRWPDGRPPKESGCRWCGIVESAHHMLWSRAVGWHVWTPPTNAQIKARRAAREKTREQE